MSSTTINIEEIKEKLIDKLRPTGWSDKLKGFIYSSDFDLLIQKLIDEREVKGKRFTPPLKHVFTSFEKCAANNIKVVIIGQDPYPQLGVADGLAFSCSITGEPQPSLKYVFDAIEKTVYHDFPITQDPDLTRCAQQGVLLLHTALTTEVGKPATHYDIWNPFMVYLLDILNSLYSGIIFILMGAKAQEFEDLLGDQHHILKVSHPMSAGYSGKEWDFKDVFNQANVIIKDANGPEFCITW